ncbi:MAG: cell division/cell wall cluster transcriptional repressor MraZ [Patescibacteria group bacterium]|nr:cell division/cell wall cluster transcriptional repressor MraZ [Patescibacteria group bacterium]
MVFFGEYQVNFSSGGRLVLPKRIREMLKGGTFVLTKGFGSYLSGYDKEDWEKRVSGLLSLSILSADDLEKRRFIFSALSYLEIDDQGRFIIPKNLLDYAGLLNKATIIGVGDHFEIWEPDSWKKYVNSHASTFKRDS